MAERLTWVANLILIGLVLGGFLRFLDAQFAGTDSLTLAVTNRVYSLNDVLRLFVIPVMSETTFAQGELIYRPAASVTFALDGLTWSLNPVGFHLTNVVLHLVATLGVFALARRLGASALAACIGATVYALHPAMVATVPVIARRDNMVSAAPFIWSLVLLARALTTRRNERWWLAGSVALFAVALLGKESGFAALPLVPLVMLMVARKLTSLWLGWPYAVVWVALFVVRWLILGSLGGNANAPVGSFDLHADLGLLTQFIRYVLWGFVAALPSDSRGWIVLAALVVLALAGIAWQLPRHARELVWLGLAWTGLFAMFFLAVRTLSGAWLMYYPLVGLAFLIAGIADGVRRSRRAAAYAAGGLASVFVASAILASPLITDYPEWRLVGETSQRYLTATVGCLVDAPDGSRVVLDRPPGFLNYPGHHNDLLVPVVVADYTVSSALQVAYPDRTFQVTDNGYGDVNWPLAPLEVTCSGSGAEWVVRASY